MSNQQSPNEPTLGGIEPFDESLLTAFLDDELAAPERAKVLQRLAIDPSAKATLQQLKQVRELVSELPGWTGQVPGVDFAVDLDAVDLDAVDLDAVDLDAVDPDAVNSEAIDSMPAVSERASPEVIAPETTDSINPKLVDSKPLPTDSEPSAGPPPSVPPLVTDEELSTRETDSEETIGVSSSDEASIVLEDQSSQPEAEQSLLGETQHITIDTSQGVLSETPESDVVIQDDRAEQRSTDQTDTDQPLAEQPEPEPATPTEVATSAEVEPYAGSDSEPEESRETTLEEPSDDNLEESFAASQDKTTGVVEENANEESGLEEEVEALAEEETLDDTAELPGHETPEDVIEESAQQPEVEQDEVDRFIAAHRASRRSESWSVGTIARIGSLAAAIMVAAVGGFLMWPGSPATSRQASVDTRNRPANEDAEQLPAPEENVGGEAEPVASAEAAAPPASLDRASDPYSTGDNSSSGRGGGFGGGYGGGSGAESLERELERAVGNSAGFNSPPARGAQRSASESTPPKQQSASNQVAEQTGSAPPTALSLPAPGELAQNSLMLENLPPNLANNDAGASEAFPSAADTEGLADAGEMTLASNLPQLPAAEPLLPSNEGLGDASTVENIAPPSVDSDADGVELGDNSYSKLPESFGKPAAEVPSPMSALPGDQPNGGPPTGDIAPDNRMHPSAAGRSTSDANDANDAAALPTRESDAPAETPLESRAADTPAVAPDATASNDIALLNSPSVDASSATPALSQTAEPATPAAQSTLQPEAKIDANTPAPTAQSSPVEARLSNAEINALLPEPDFKPETPLAGGRHYVFHTDAWQQSEVEPTLEAIAPLIGIGRRRLPRNLPAAVASLEIEGDDITVLASEVAKTLDGLELLGKPSGTGIDKTSTIVALASPVQVDAIIRELSVARRQRLGAAWLRPGGSEANRRAILIIQANQR